MDSHFVEGEVNLTAGVLAIGGKQYQIRQINTTEVLHKPRTGLAIFLGIAAGYLTNLIFQHQSSVIIGIVVALVAYMFLKKHTLVFTTSSGSVSALSSTNKDFVIRVRDAISIAQNRLAQHKEVS